MNETPDIASDADPGMRAGRTDGRRLRSERTRRLIIEAYMALVRETSQMPTAVQIAERAGYSVRSIFERFPDLHALRVAVTDHAISEARSTGVLRDLDGDRLTRIHSQVDQRGRGCERWLPLWRVLSTDLAASPDLHQRIGMIRLPEVCANVCFCGPKRDHLFMAGSQSAYLLHVGVQGAAIG